MKIGISGAANVGTVPTGLFSAKGHEIMRSFSKDAGKLARTAKACGAPTN
jgi:predicted dinucleotide-binding enzyme